MEPDTICRIVQGEREPFRRLYDECFDYAMRTAALVAKNREWAKDAVQETFLHVCRNIWQYDRAKPFKPRF